MSKQLPDHLPEAAHWQPRLHQWAARLHAAHLGSLVDLLLAAAEPLAPFGAHVLWVAQPVLGLVVARDEVASLARLLDAPGGLAWLRTQLTGAEQDDTVF